jgi:hypothetical protein
VRGEAISNVMALKYHKTLTEERWKKFSFSKQIIMIANELNRAGNWLKKDDSTEVRLCYERAFELLYLTISALKDNRKLKELLRFQEMLAYLYTNIDAAVKENSALLKALISLDKDSFALLNN